jgi:Uma2 family endonuclease
MNYLNTFPTQLSEPDILLRLNASANQALCHAKIAARQLDHAVVDSGHLLLGLLAEETGLAAQILKSKGVTLKNAQQAIKQALNQRNANEEGKLTFSLAMQKSLRITLDITLEQGHHQIDTGHLLAGLLRQERLEPGATMQLLRRFKVDLETLEQQIANHLTHHRLMYLSQISWSLGGGDLASYHPIDRRSSEIAACLTAWLVSWVDSHKLGRVYSINTGLRLPNQDIQALGISFISEVRLAQNQNLYLESAPDLVIEIKSIHEPVLSLQASIQRCLDLGTQAGVLINPDDHIVTVYDANGDVSVLGNDDTLKLPSILPDWKLPVSSLWTT